MKLAVASDHGGIELKDEIVKFLKSLGHDVDDIGTYSTDSVDYPDYAFKAGEKVVSGEVERGILVCGTGIGMSIAANKIKGIFCAKVNSPEEGALASEHNLANMIALGGRTTKIETALEIVKNWIETPYGGQRHQRRVNLIREKDKNN